MQTTRRRDGDHYVLNGAKMWITNGAVSDTELGDVFLVYARTGDEGTRSLSLFLVEKGIPGFRARPEDQGQARHARLDHRRAASSTTAACRRANLLGDEGDAVGHMMRNLEIERLTLAAMCLGIARRCLEVMIALRRRAQGLRPADPRVRPDPAPHRRVYAESWRGAATSTTSPARSTSTDAATASTPTASSSSARPWRKEVADRAIQVLGGYGYVGEYVVERLWRDAKLLEIGGGTLEAHQKNIARDLARIGTIP